MCSGRRTRILFSDGTSQTTAYDALSRPVVQTDARGNNTSLGYDSLGRLTSITDALGDVSRNTFDALGRLIAQTDALGHTTGFEYDALGRRTGSSMRTGRRKRPHTMRWAGALRRPTRPGTPLTLVTMTRDA